MLKRFFGTVGIAVIFAGSAACEDGLTRTVQLTSAGGKEAGRVMLSDAPAGVLVHIEVTGLSPGWHAVHFHDRADCSDPMFKSAGGHVHPMGMQTSVHGLLNSAATDDGDLPNIFADHDGRAAAELFSSRVALRGGTSRSDLLDADGSAIVIHANPDDYRSQPIGGAGPRIACGVIRK